MYIDERPQRARAQVESRDAEHVEKS
jgi:hypothetical protein